MNEKQLTELFLDIYAQHHPKLKWSLFVEFGRFRTMRHTIALEKGIITVRLSRLIQNAPREILQALARILLAKLFRQYPPIESRQLYNTYIRSIQNDLPEPVPRQVSRHYQAGGKYFDLQEIFQRLNEQFFENRLTMPVLGWSLKKAYTRLGFYDRQRNLLVISRIFDAKKTDPLVIDFLMYHEMLHMDIPIKTIAGRRRIHPAAFKKREREFPQFEQIQKWIRRRRFRL